MSKKTKNTHTYSISNDVYEEFSLIIDSKMLNKSKIIESLIIKWIKENNIS
jgi:hypothetical protein